MSAPIRLWYCPDCGLPSYLNSYTRPGKQCIYTAHLETRVRQMTAAQTAEVAAQFHPDWRAEVAKEQAA